jgi:hypothetical protein
MFARYEKGRFVTSLRWIIVGNHEEMREPWIQIFERKGEGIATPW